MFRSKGWGGVGCVVAVALVVGGVGGAGVPAHAASVTTTDAPEPATGVTASADDGDVVTVRWTPSSTADVTSYVARGVTSTPSTSALVFGKVVKFSGVVTDRQTHRPEPHVIVTLLAARVGQQDYAVADTVNADANGRWTISLDPQLSYQYVAIAHSGGDHLGGASAIRVVTVAALVIVDVVAKKVKHGKVGLQRLVKGKWTKAASAKQGKDGTVVFKVKLARQGVYTYRATRAADADHKAGISKTVKITAT